MQIYRDFLTVFQSVFDFLEVRLKAKIAINR